MPFIGSGLSVSHPWPRSYIAALSTRDLEWFVHTVRLSPVMSYDDDIMETVRRIQVHLGYYPSRLLGGSLLMGGSISPSLVVQSPQPAMVIQQHPALQPSLLQMQAAPPRVVYETVDHLGHVVSRSYGDQGAAGGAAAAETAEDKEKREFEDWKRANGK